MSLSKFIQTSVFSVFIGAGSSIVGTVAMMTAADAANVRACTNANQIVNVAIAYPTDVETFTMAGWWRIPANGCIDLPATPRNETHYFFAYTQNRDYVWPTATGRQFCLNNQKFTYPGWKDFLPCPPSSERRFFWPMNPVGGVINVEFNY